MTENQIAKIIAEIARLKNELEQLKAQGKTATSENEANRLKRKIDYLELVEKGKTGIERLAVLESRISLINRQIETLNSAKMTMYEEMSLVRYLFEVIDY